jgi:hypothetical protein
MDRFFSRDETLLSFMCWSIDIQMSKSLNGKKKKKTIREGIDHISGVIGSHPSFLILSPKELHKENR